jgi:putative SOS response-associated peptidase YedK
MVIPCKAYRDFPAPVVRHAAAERELTMMRWGMPPPPKTGGPPVTNIRNTSSPHLAEIEHGRAIEEAAEFLCRSGSIGDVARKCEELGLKPSVK